jgi:uncharacterized protein YqeY
VDRLLKEQEKFAAKISTNTKGETEMITTLRSKLTESRKLGKKLELSMLSLVLGEVDTIEGRGKKVSNEEVEKIIRKIIVSNTETMNLMREKGGITGSFDLPAENAFLNTLLPKTLTKEEIKHLLTNKMETNKMEMIKSAKSDGQATGIAMKILKEGNHKVLGEDVAGAVKEMRV